MLILLPPSEGKAAPRRGGALSLDRLSFPELGPLRERVLDALGAVATRPDACDVLGVPATLADLVARNARLRSAPTATAARIYTGVLYDALGLATLPTGAKRRAASSLVVVSALFGALRPGDRVPAYRLAMDVDLPGVGPLAGAWRTALDPVLTAAAGSGLVIDCRSSTYAAAWRPGPELAARTVAVRVLRDDAGTRTVVSHMAKQARGAVARELLLAHTIPRRPDALPGLLAGRFATELARPARSGQPWTLDVVIPA